MVHSPAGVGLTDEERPVVVIVGLLVDKGSYFDVESALTARHLSVVENLELGVSEGVDIVQHDLAVCHTVAYTDHTSNWI